MIRLFLKSLVRGGAAADLFATQVEVHGHTTKEGTYVAPHRAIRHKRVEAPAKPAPAPAGDLFTSHKPEPAAKPYGGPVAGGSLFDYQPAPKVDQAAVDAAAVARWAAAADAELRRLSADEMDIAAGIEAPSGTEDQRSALLLALAEGARSKTVEQMNASAAAVRQARGDIANLQAQPAAPESPPISKPAGSLLLASREEWERAIYAAAQSRFDAGADVSFSTSTHRTVFSPKNRDAMRLHNDRIQTFAAGKWNDLGPLGQPIDSLAGSLGLPTSFARTQARADSKEHQAASEAKLKAASIELLPLLAAREITRAAHVADVDDRALEAADDLAYKTLHAAAKRLGVSKYELDDIAAQEEDPRADATPEIPGAAVESTPTGPWGVPAGTTEAVRRKLNAAAAALLESKRDDEMTPADKDVLAQYTGNGGCGASLNEFYTEPDIADAMWTMLRAAGFAGGEVLEPSCGTGVFLRTAPADAKVVGVEIDTISSRIAGILHPRHDVRLASLERFATQDGSLFDAVIGNAPFGGRGDSAKGDPDKLKITTHEQYFLDTGLDKLKDGGLMAMVVNTSIMNAKNGRAFRERLLRKAEFLGAHRLPNSAFEAANTDVTTDILLFRKRPADVAGALGTLTQAQFRATGAWNADYLAGYFEKSGQANVHGTVGTAMRAFGPIYTVDGAMNGVAAHLAEWTPDAPQPQPDMPRVLAELGDDEDAKKRALDASRKRAYQTAKVGDVQVIDGVRYILQGDPPRWHRLEAEVPKAVTDAMAISEGLDDLLEGRAKDPRLVRAQVAEGLDDYISEHGLPAKSKELMTWLAAPALERQEGWSAADHQKHVHQTRRRVALLLGAVDKDGAYSDAITGRTADKGEAGLESTAELLSTEFGGFSIDQLAGRAGQSPEAVLDYLHASPSLAIEADGKTWTTMDTYLSGELWPKLDAANAAAEDEALGAEYRKKYIEQARVLEEAITPKSLEDVEILLSSGFITPQTMNAYFAQRAEKEKENYNRPEYAPRAVTVRYDDAVYTVSGGDPLAKFVAKYLNREGVKKDDRDFLNRLNEDFAEWARTGPLRDEIEDRYNRLYRGFRQREYSDAKMVIPGLRQAIDVNAYHYSGLRWALDQGKGVVADDVGLGKTTRGMMIAKLAKVHGTAKKPVFVVPKSVLANWVEETQTWFPGSRVLVIGESYQQNADGSFKVDKTGKLVGKAETAAQRREKYHALKQNDYDFVLVSKPSWDKLDLSPELKERYQSDQFWEMRRAALETGKAAEKRQQKAQDAHDLKMASRQFHDHEETIYFDDLGVDMIIMDEGHCFPAGTLVDGRPIESYRAGDTVLAFDHEAGKVVRGRVKNLQVRRPSSLYRLGFSDGNTIVCTGNHPFFTPDGYVPAERLVNGDVCYKNLYHGAHEQAEDEAVAPGRSALGDGGLEVRQLQGDDAVDEGAGLASARARQDAVLLRQAVRYALETGATGHPLKDRSWPEEGTGGLCQSLRALSAPAWQRDATPGGSGEGEREPQGSRHPASQTRRKRQRVDQASDDVACGAGRGMGAGVHHSTALAEAVSVAMVLRGGFGPASPALGGGSGRFISQDAAGQRARPQEGSGLVAIRVDSVEVLEPGSAGGYGGLCPGGVVFNIEVERHHNYFAEGVLVHNCYKNLFAAKNRFGMTPKFLGGSGESKTAQDTYFKSRYVRQENNGKGVFLLTATPTKNSPLEIYSMLSHIAPEAFEHMGIKNSEDFIDRFVEFTPDHIIGVDGEIKECSVTSGFKNLDELRQVMRRYINRRTAEDVGLVIPEADNIDHLLDMSPEQEAVYVGLRQEAANAASNKDDATGESHTFSIMSRMQKASTDLGLLGHVGTISPKIEEVADNAFIYAAEGGQIIFCEPVDSHETIAQALIKRGVPRDQIAIINAEEAPDGSDRQKICAAFNTGKVKYVIGNKTMEQGVNLQKLTSDIHHVDLPWEPATLQQRNGRGRRQGNKRARIRIHTYLAKKSFDVYRHQTIAAKRNWMDLLWNGGDRVENLGREGGFSLSDVSIMLAADPEAALAKRQADTGAAIERKNVADRARAVQSWKRLRLMQASLAKLTAENRGQTHAAGRLGLQIDRARVLMHKNPSFPHKDLIDGNEPAIVEPVTGIAWRAGMGMEMAPGPESALNIDGDRPERFVVETVDQPGNQVWLRSVGGRRRSAVSLTAEQLQGGVTPWTHTAAAEAEEAAHFLESKGGDLVDLAVAHHDLSKVHALPPSVAAKHAETLQAQMKDRVSNYKMSVGYGDVPMVEKSTGKVEMVPGHSYQSKMDTHEFMLPTPEHREAAMGAWVDERMSRSVENRYQEPAHKNRYEVLGVKASYPSASYSNKAANPWKPALAIHGKDAEQEASARVRTRVAANIAAAPTMHAAFEAAQPSIRLAQLGHGGGWPEATVRALWDKAKASGVLEQSLGAHATQVEPAKQSWSQPKVKAAGHAHFYKVGSENWTNGQSHQTVAGFLTKVAPAKLKAELEATPETNTVGEELL